MFLLKTVGMFAPSYSSTALCVQRMKNPTYRCGRDDLSFDLVFFNTLEELTLPIKGQMEDAGVIKLYEPSPTRCLYVAPGPAENMVGRVPLIPMFLAGNSTPTIPQIPSQVQQAQGFRLPVRVHRRSGSCGQQREGGAAMFMRLTPGR